MKSVTHTEPAIESGADLSRPTEDEIGALAYQLWEDRGCPAGSADEDWFQAEAQLMNGQVASAAAAGAAAK